MHHTEYSMNKPSTQLTIRGIDDLTKKALQTKAKQEGVSLNRYVVKAIKRGAGIDEVETRYQRLKKIIEENPINKEDLKTLNEVILWSKKESLKKQSKQEL
jgi:hypothetical protein